MITTGGELKARYVIHTVGPVWHGGNHGEAGLLASAYTESLKVASERGLRTVSFPSISTGAYGYPLQEAARVALDAVMSFLAKNKDSSVKEVTFVLFGRDAMDAYGTTLTEIAPD